MQPLKFIDPFTDTGFKIIFGKEHQSEDILMDFLNELFKDDPTLNNIKSLRYLNVERSRNHDSDKLSIYDIFCETESGHRYIVEMQTDNKTNFLDRTIYYMSRAIVDQARRNADESTWKYRLLPVIGVFLANFHIKGLEEKLITHAGFTDMENHKIIGNKIRCAFIQFKYFNKSEDECTSGIDKWLYVLKNMKDMQILPFKTRKDDVFERLERVSSIAALSPEERYQYEKDLKWSRDYHAEMDYARQEAAEEGRAEGRAEERNKMIQKMKDAGLDPSLIAQITGLDKEEVL